MESWSIKGQLHAVFYSYLLINTTRWRETTWDEVSCLRYETINAVALGQVLKPKVEIVRPTINSPYLDPLSPQVLLKVLAFIVRRKDLEKLLLEGLLDGHMLLFF